MDLIKDPFTLSSQASSITCLLMPSVWVHQGTQVHTDIWCTQGCSQAHVQGHPLICDHLLSWECKKPRCPHMKEEHTYLIGDGPMTVTTPWSLPMPSRCIKVDTGVFFLCYWTKLLFCVPLSHMVREKYSPMGVGCFIEENDYRNGIEQSLNLIYLWFWLQLSVLGT